MQVLVGVTGRRPLFGTSSIHVRRESSVGAYPACLRQVVGGDPWILLRGKVVLRPPRRRTVAVNRH